MSKSGEECPKTARTQTKWIEQQFKAGQNIDRICEIFSIDPKTLHQEDFFFFLADIYTIGV